MKIVVFDEFGRLTQEKNRIDGTQSYTYNDNSELKTKKDFEGNMTAVSYDTKTRTKRTQYADGTESIIVYDECGNVLSATNESGTLSYIYDKAGMLTKETDSKTGETVSYFYDKAGRRTRLVSRERDISYGYGKNSELLLQKDRLKQLEVHYKYDVCGREIERRFGNGVTQKTRYDKAGRTVNIAQYTSNGNLISGEAYVYDKLGRRSMTVNEKGLVTIYKYDNQSRLETVYYPFNEDIKETARKEADKQGLYFQPSQGNAENYFLSSAEMMQLRGVAENFARQRGNAITTNQVVWKESYTYDANGNRTSKTTAWGTVQYAYDKENRLTESGELGKSESVKYTYDANGNLLRESAARYRKDYVYNAQNRMSFSDVQDSVLNTRNFTEYAYDAFGRRIETKEYLGDYTRNLYDGFSFDVLGKSVLQSAYSANVPVQKYRDGQSSQLSHPELVSGSAPNNRTALGSEIGTRYRYIDDTPLVPMTEAGKANGTNAASSASGAKTRSRPNNEYVLYSYGEPVAMSADGNASYFGTDILGSVRSVTDKYGTVQASYDYDAFGSPYLGNLENDIGFGYCGKSYDVGTGLYDYGFRDYSPVSARFTTIDPIRDGSNWFSYVVNDPVNYVDPFGLSSTDRSGWSNVKNTVKGWIDSAKSDFIQTWNDIKGVVSTTISDTKAAVSAVVANVGKSITAWATQAKAAVNKTLSDISVVGNNIKTEAARLITKVGVNLFGGDSTKQFYNDALNGKIQNYTISSTPEDNNYGLSDNLKNEVGNTEVWIEGMKSYKPFTDTIAEELTLNNGTLNTYDYNAKTGESGLSDMGTIIGGHTVHLKSDMDSETGRVIVHVYAHDTFDFEKGNGKRNPIGETLTSIGRNADLPNPDIEVQYNLVFNYYYNENKEKVYYYAE